MGRIEWQGGPRDFLIKRSQKWPNQTEGRLANCGAQKDEDRGTGSSDCLRRSQSRAECTDLREPGRENAEASGAPC